MTSGIGQMTRHAEYYIRDGNITFLAEGTLFRVHKSFFERESEFFRTLFAASGDHQHSDGGSDDKPYTLSDVTSEEFAQFLWVWYNPKYTYSREGKDKWLTILRLANRWKFPEIRELAIRQLEELHLPPVEKIATYKEYNVDHNLLYPSYMALCRSPTLPSPSEGARLTMETVLKLMAARERALLRASASGCTSPTSASASNEDMESIISELFGLPLQSNGTTVGVGGQANGTDISTPTITVREPEVPGGRGSSSNGQGSQNVRRNGEHTNPVNIKNLGNKGTRK